MKLVRVSAQNSSSLPCILDSKFNARQIPCLEDLYPEEILKNLPEEKLWSSEEWPLVGPIEELKILPCVPIPRQFLAIAFNSKQHCKQMGMEPLDEPIFFIKTTTAICGANDPLVYPRLGKKVDWEAELGVVIGKKGKYITKETALDYVFGYCCANDFSDRHWQFEHAGTQYVKGKSFETFSPLGPYLVTKDEIPNPNDLQVTLKVNGETRQAFSTKDYQFSVEEIIAFLSQFFPLYPGDVISMGSGPGSAKMWNYQYLKVGDTVEFEIEKLGKQKKVVIAETN